MIQYDIEGGIDFYKELLNDAGEDVSLDSQTKVCLLTDEKLLPDAVTLNCGHSFNYKPLFKEVVFQKCSILPKNISSSMLASYVKINNTSGSTGSSMNHSNEVMTLIYNGSTNLETTKLGYNEIKCPYCRTITPKLLPYYPYPDVKQIRYVNSPPNLCLSAAKCIYYDLKQNTDKCCSNTPTYHETYGLLCKVHLKSIMSSSGSRKHDNIILTENVIVYNCSYKLTSGERKGCPCGGKEYTPPNLNLNPVHNNTELPMPTPAAAVVLCKRHYNMTHK